MKDRSINLAGISDEDYHAELQALQDRLSSSTTSDKDPWRLSDNLKVEINAFLWTHLPPEMTLGNAEDISIAIWDLIETKTRKYS